MAAAGGGKPGMCVCFAAIVVIILCQRGLYHKHTKQITAKSRVSILA